MDQLLGNNDNAGVTGGERPKPTAVGEGAPPPKIGFDDDQMPTGDKGQPKKAARDDRRAEADPQPGFSLK